MAEHKQIRNFCIIAHIDHGKSTLADRMLEKTKTIESRKMQEQLLDSMDLERERGITIKLQPVRMEYKHNILNLIDTPGHVDFQYEVSRSLKAVEGAILLIDATQGIQAQTITNLYMALETDLNIIPVINKIDLPAAQVDEVKKQIKDILGEEEIIAISAKTGEGVDKVLDTIVEKVEPAQTHNEDKLKALIFDSIYDEYKGVVAYVRIMQGCIKKQDEIYFPGTDQKDNCVETGIMSPLWKPTDSLSAGDIGYIATGLKDVRQARVGDTIILAKDKEGAQPLPGFAVPQPKLFAGLYPEEGDKFSELRKAIEKLQLNDASLQVKAERNEALGKGFRCGFLGMLHLEITQERLQREWQIELVITTPSVSYKIITSDGTEKIVKTPARWPDSSAIEKILERFVDIEVITPTEYIGNVFDLLQQSEGEFEHQEYLGSERVLLKYKMPLRKMVVDLYDLLKSSTAGYGSLSYSIGQWRETQVVKLDILVNRETIEALSIIVGKKDATVIGRKMVEKLKKTLPKQQFSVPIQAAVGGDIVARETLPALRKDVTAKLYGGDVTRKRKLLEKQKKGKKKMAGSSSIQIPANVYIDVLRGD